MSELLNILIYTRYIVQKTVDIEMVIAYWLIGKDIFEEEQKGQKRAEYGILLLTAIADRLTEKYGSIPPIHKFFTQCL